eukprot:CAMPEP_0201484482 /NCGR_PEP_ID=MMETSP0151_2-20130828/8668_1 /ASSEMBLY_ACC=CAM_ASM_000257 /TAXON_ID=200890 /ORGANISM="Paramoeba atlantica, Strain 621/1 / CCAP 1560/9" /LENGTH=193 /DNA_ID=CAMNT_0047868173 /DNA_START=14 /DNA_END=595 /DNA_ORIENTATION=+
MASMKIILFGTGSVGKSALTVQYVQGIFVSKYDPTIEDSYRKVAEIDGKTYQLEIMDTAGTETFTAMRDLYMKGGDGFVLVYSITSSNSLSEVSDIHDQIVRVKDDDSANIPCVLVGNKCDLIDQRSVPTDQGLEVSKGWGAGFVEASAKTRQNVDTIFEEAVRRIERSREKSNEVIGEKKKSAAKKNRCLLL